MKTRLLSILLALCMALAITACGGSGGSSAAESAVNAAEQDIAQPDSEDTATEEIFTEETVTAETSTSGSAADDTSMPDTAEPTFEETDPYDVLKMDEAARSHWASNGGGVYLVRDGTYYSLSTRISREKATEYQVGYIWPGSNSIDGALITSDLGDYYITLGDIPVITIEADDMVIGDGGRTLLGLTPATLEGYSIKVCASNDGAVNGTICILFPSPNDWVYVKQSAKQFEMVDSRGNMVQQPDFINLIRGETYTVSWFEGTTYYEYTMEANSPYYKVDWAKLNVPTYNIEGELHREGYASFDLSDIPPGLYYVTTSGFGSFISIPE